MDNELDTAHATIARLREELERTTAATCHCQPERDYVCWNCKGREALAATEADSREWLAKVRAEERDRVLLACECWLEERARKHTDHIRFTLSRAAAELPAAIRALGDEG
jgi:hypothetical protein